MRICNLLAAVSLAGLAGPVIAGPTKPVHNIVLVHGAFADGSGWRQVADMLRTDGYAASVVQEPETSLADDVATTKRILDLQSGPTILVGHSYGGAVITEAGNHPNVAALVYVAALAPDEGENLTALQDSIPPAASHFVPSADGFLTINQATFPGDVGADVPLATTQFMAISQVPLNARIFVEPITAPA